MIAVGIAITLYILGAIQTYYSLVDSYAKMATWEVAVGIVLWPLIPLALLIGEVWNG